MVLPGTSNKVIIRILILGLLILTFCKKKEDTGNIRIDFYLTDAPSLYKSLTIDIEKISFRYEGSAADYEVQLKNPVICNLLDYSNGHDTLLGSRSMPPGKISQVNIIFGQNNSFVNDSENVILQLSPAIDNGLSITASVSITGEKIIKVWIDFDATQSVISAGSGIYFLNAKARFYSGNNSGGFRGVVIPEDRRPFVYAISASDSIGTLTDSKGHFQIMGLSEGLYKVRFIPQKPGVNQAVLDSIEVKNDSIKNIGTIVIN